MEVANAGEDKKRISRCEAAGYIEDVHEVCTHPEMLSLVRLYR